MNDLQPRIRLSDLLVVLLESKKGQERVTLREMIEVFGIRAYGPLLLVFALPNAVPSIPGLLAILGAPLLFLSVQMALGRVPWLPNFLGKQSIAYGGVEKIQEKALPWLKRADRFVRPRFLFLT